MRLRLLQLKNWRKRQRIKQHPAVYLQRHFVILMHLIFIFLQTTEQKAPHIGLGCSLHKQWGLGQVSNNIGITISLPISHANSGYKILVTHYNGVTPDSVVSLSVGQRKESDFYVSNKTNDNPAFFWFTIGQ